MTDSDDFANYFPPNSVSAFIAEHVWEHLSLQEGIDALVNVRFALKMGGAVRIAVPDRLSYCTSGFGELHRTDMRDEHVVQFDRGLLSALFLSAGFSEDEILTLEHHTETGQHVVHPESNSSPVFQDTNVKVRWRV